MVAVISEGALTQADSATGYANWYAATSGSLDLYTSNLDYASIYRTQPAVRRVLSFAARNIAQLGLHVFRRTSDIDRQRLTAHPLTRLLASPDPTRKVTTYRLLDDLVQDRGIYGHSYFAKVTAPGDREPSALVRLMPWRMVPVGSLTKVNFYRYVGTAGFIDLPPEQVVVFRYYNPTDGRVGISPLETLRRVLAEDMAASDYRERFWRKGAKLAGYITRPREAGKWSDPARTRFLADWAAQNAGSGPNVGGTAVLEDGMTYAPGASTFRDAQYLEAHKLTLEEAAGAFHMPPPMVGILDNANYSNTREFHKMLYQDCLGPDLEMIQQEFEAQLVPDFRDTQDVYVEFNIAEKLKGSFEEQAAALSLAVGGPWMVRTEARARQNLPPFDDPEEQAEAGRLIVPMNVTEGGQAAPNAPQPDLVANIAKSFRSKQERSILSKAGALEEPTLAAVWHGAKWDSDLALELTGVVPDPETAAQEINAETKRAVAAALTDAEPLAALRAAFRRLT